MEKRELDLAKVQVQNQKHFPPPRLPVAWKLKVAAPRGGQRAGVLLRHPSPEEGFRSRKGKKGEVGAHQHFSALRGGGVSEEVFNKTKP